MVIVLTYSHVFPITQPPPTKTVIVHCIEYIYLCAILSL